ncbi:MAG: DMT family transporter [Phycisphaerae bacterium]|nr:DMT family transporter [Phycisphaerae bacterium]
MWLYLAIISACFLGLSQVSKKHALLSNAILPVLFLSTVCGALLVMPIIVLSLFLPEYMNSINLFVPPADLSTHLHIVGKAVIVSTAWLLGYIAMKHLPISIVMPVGATSPVWTLLGAIIIFHERLNWMQYLGFTIMAVSYYYFSVIGKKEGIKFHADKWILCVLLAAVCGSTSALYDKYLIQRLYYPPLLVPVWVLIYMVPLLAAATVIFWFPNRKNGPFDWRWSVPITALLLIAADILYFRALSSPDALISMLSTTRSSHIVVSFFVGGLLFKELRLSLKAIALAGILIGLCFILRSS